MKILQTTAFAAMALATATLAQAPPVPKDEAAVPRISQAEFAKRMEKPGMVVVDVRALEGYKAGHIPGAISLPLNDIQQRWKELPKDKLIVTYCS